MSLVEKPTILAKLSFAETDHTFPTESRRRAEDILAEKKATYHIQVFSGVVHGFATRGDPTVDHIRAHLFSFAILESNSRMRSGWAKEESARSVINWFLRFSS